MPFASILFDVDERGIARIVLNRPERRNAMTPEMGAEVRQAVERVNTDDAARVAVISGAGGAFCSGADLESLAREAGLRKDGAGLGGEGSFYRSFLSIASLRVPSIAAINGHAVGAGLCFALGADLRVMHERAKAGMTFVRLGIHPGMGGTWNLPRLVGPAAAADLLYSGRLLGAAEALSIGLVNRVAGDDFDEVVGELAAQIAACAPLAVRALKESLRDGALRSLEEALDVEARAQAMTFRTADAAEGLAALLEKRPPRFQGR
ncbi:MAG: enoyl-CoA hydratase/isomerase family protein [Planctomycetes bacterium]|nr:enoyl-CoA hydratase/isomerase family protein [Planctomycetota bacterium]